jgi:mevalonate kinase
MATQACACGKAILLGEHAVVYGRPAIAVPIPGRTAVADVQDAAPGTGVVIVAHDLNQRYRMGASDVDKDGQFMLAAVQGVLQEVCPGRECPDLEISVRSTIPIARGLGSGAAVSAAIARAIAAHLGITIPQDQLSDLVFATECLLHGTPSGIDNTVVCCETPVWFQRGSSPEPFAVGRPFGLVIGDTGIPSRTSESVAMVRRRRDEKPEVVEALLNAIGDTVTQGRTAIAQGDLVGLGRAMDRNQGLLQELGVSDPALDALVGAARGAGALGAKLSGGGMGGCMIALVAQDSGARVEDALRAAGALDTIVSQVESAA